MIEYDVTMKGDSLFFKPSSCLLF